MIHFEGMESCSSAPDIVFAQLSDAEFLARCLPDSTVLEANPDRAVWKVRPKLAFLSGELDTVATVVDRQPGQSVRYRLETKGVGSGSVVEAVLQFSADDAGTQVKWSGDITALSGLLKLAPKGLVQATAQKVIGDVWASIKPRVGV
jgi:carbon monoxide dehydrogenase subunit G